MLNLRSAWLNLRPRVTCSLAGSPGSPLAQRTMCFSAEFPLLWILISYHGRCHVTHCMGSQGGQLTGLYPAKLQKVGALCLCWLQAASSPDGTGHALLSVVCFNMAFLHPCPLFITLSGTSVFLLPFVSPWLDHPGFI